jgi:hypothetical protein
MNKIYSTDECNNLEAFTKEIRKWEKEGLIECIRQDLDTYKIVSIDMDSDDIDELSSILEELDVYEIADVEEDDWDPYYDDEEEDDYFGSKRGKKYKEDDDFDF